MNSTTKQLITELCSDTLPISRQVAVVDELVNKRKISREELSERTGLSKSTITLRKKMKGFEPEILAYYDKGELPIVRPAIMALLQIPKHTRMKMVPYLVERGEATASKILDFTKPHIVKKQPKRHIQDLTFDNVPTDLKLMNKMVTRVCVWCGAMDSKPEIRDATCGACPLAMFVNLTAPTAT